MGVLLLTSDGPVFHLGSLVLNMLQHWLSYAKISISDHVSSPVNSLYVPQNCKPSLGHILSAIWIVWQLKGINICSMLMVLIINLEILI